MKKLIIAWVATVAALVVAAIVLATSHAHSADLKLQAAPAPYGCMSAAYCTGWYLKGSFGGEGSSVDVLGSGLTNSVFSNGMELGGGGGLQLWNGTYFAAIEAGGGLLIPAAGQVVSLSDRAYGEVLFKLGAGLNGLFVPATGAPAVLQTLSGNVIAPYGIIGGRFKTLGSGLVTGAGLQYYLAKDWTIDVQYLHVAYEGAVDGTGVPVHTDNIARIELAKHFSF